MRESARVDSRFRRADFSAPLHLRSHAGFWAGLRVCLCRQERYISYEPASDLPVSADFARCDDADYLLCVRQ